MRSHADVTDVFWYLGGMIFDSSSAPEGGLRRIAGDSLTKPMEGLRTEVVSSAGRRSIGAQEQRHRETT